MIQANLSQLTRRWRGDEMNADGLLWQCANCSIFTVPGRKLKNRGYEHKECPNCSLRLQQDEVREVSIVSDHSGYPFNEPCTSTGQTCDTGIKSSQTDGSEQISRLSFPLLKIDPSTKEREFSYGRPASSITLADVAIVFVPGAGPVVATSSGLFGGLILTLALGLL